MGIFVDPAIVDYQLPTAANKFSIADYRLVPITDY
jgi:hypothetical protein